MKKLVLVDGSNMLFRAYYAIPAHLSTSSGQPTNAVYGFVNMLSKLLDKKKPDYCCVVFDPPGGSFRHRESEDYKANRSEMPGDLASQLPLIDEAVRAFNLTDIRVTDFEADDVIATLAKEAEELGANVLIVSSDKDFSQLLTERVSMLDGMKDLTYTPELVEKKFGVSPERFVDFQALCGDKIDNIPGVPGIGKKTASKLLDEYGSLKEILAQAESVKGSVGKKLQDHREDALLSQKLARLDTTVAHGLSFEELKFEAPTQDALNALYSQMEFYSLLKSTGAPAESASKSESATRVFVEGDSLCSFTGRVVATLVGPELGLNLGTEEDSVFVPLSTGAGAIGEFLSSFDGELVVHDAREFFRFCLRRSYEVPQNVFDSRTASYLLDPGKGMPHDLGRLVKIHLHRVLPGEDELLGKGRKKKAWSDLGVEELARYGGERVQAIRELAVDFEMALQSEDLQDIAAQEVELSLVLARMELAGITLDKEGLQALSEEFREHLQGLQQAIYELAGREFNIGSPKQLATVLFEELELPVIKKTKTGYSTNAEVLERLAKDHEIARQLLQYRKFEKLISTYVDVLLRDIDPVDGRIHCQFNQTASTTGRLITSDPDLQRTPVKTEEGRRIRRLFLAPEGHQLLVADWSQVELRILAHLSQDPILLDAFGKDADIHRRTASELFDKAEDAVTREERDTAKTVNFATIYGQGASALGQNLGIPKKKAAEIIARYFEVYAGVKAWIDRTMEEARVVGSVQTIAGRARFIPELFSKNFAVKQAGERMAVNTPVQGSAADICKKVMLDIDKALRKRRELKSRMLLQIHDELVFECPESELNTMKDLVTQHMENAWPLSVPLRVSVGTGPSWEEAK